VLPVRESARGGVAVSAVSEKQGEPLLAAVGLRKRFPLRRGPFGARRGFLPALSGVSFSVQRGETLGLVGESGSGKTTVARIVARLETADEGRVLFEGEDWLSVSGTALDRLRGDLQMVFQDPGTSLNPRMRVGSQIAEPLLVRRRASRRAAAGRVMRLLDDVGLSPEVAARFPEELSGGQRQRVAIARALATDPRFLVCDEPVSALDVSVAAQILNLLLDLRDRVGLAYLFISHDLAVVSGIADRIAVMYMGRIAEEGPSDELAGRPLHPYTVALLSASPRPDPAMAGRRVVLSGEPPSAAEPPGGCPFHPRCPIARSRCREETPALEPAAPGRSVACFYPGEMQ
jgi:oligopeptide/dipeptide ABC transporter ATP-binding protein